MACTLTIADLKRWGAITPACRTSGQITSRWANTGRVLSKVAYIVDTQAQSGRLIIESITRFTPWDEEKTEPGNRLQLLATRQPFGGLRWWFICPFSGRRVSKVYLPLVGPAAFASRHAYRLGYACQRESRRDRALRQARRARQKIGGGNNLSEPLPGKPKWMRWDTYDRLRRDAITRDAKVVGYSAPLLQQLWKRVRARTRQKRPVMGSMGRHQGDSP
jgi:hypothetical protein